jgi:hypothetical protein
MPGRAARSEQLFVMTRQCKANAATKLATMASFGNFSIWKRSALPGIPAGRGNVGVASCGNIATIARGFEPESDIQ